MASFSNTKNRVSIRHRFGLMSLCHVVTLRGLELVSIELNCFPDLVGLVP